MKRSILLLFILLLTMIANDDPVRAATALAVAIDPPSIQANMGDQITYTGTITNDSNTTVHNVIAYISLANVTAGKEAPMDLEDWSANKAVKVDSIAPHATYRGEWPMRLIDSGMYVAYITIVDKNGALPVSSTLSHLEVKRIIRLNPNNVLPVVLGEPILIGSILLLIRRKRKYEAR